METETVTCIVCGKGYPAEDGRRARNGRHFHCCSDACQEKFLADGGLQKIMRPLKVGGPVPKTLR